MAQGAAGPVTAPIAPGQTDTAYRRLLWLLLIALVFCAAFPLANLYLGKGIKDYELWHEVGQRVLQGEQIYPPGNTKFDFIYPPAPALLLAPLSLLGQAGVMIFLLLLNAVAWLACIFLAPRLAQGNWQRPPLLLYFLPNLFVAAYVFSNFLAGQPNLLLLALMLGAFVALQRKWNKTAGALIGLASAIKAFPLIALIYLLYRRFWTAAASLVLTLAFFLILLPAPFRGFGQARYDLQRWCQGMLFKYDDKGVAQRPGRSYSWRNQSVFGVANRLLRHVDADDQNKPHLARYANVADLGFATVNRIILAFALALGFAFIAVIPARDRRTDESDAIEFALLILLMLIFSPLAWFGSLFVWLLLPFTVIVQRLLQRPDRSLGAFVFSALALLALGLPWQKTAQLYGSTFFATLLLFLGLATALARSKRSLGAKPA